MKRPISVTLVSWLFIISGTAGILYHAKELTEIFTQTEGIWLLVIRLLAIVGGWFALRGNNIARWLLVLWIAYHVALSLYHPPAELIMHVVIMIMVLIGLFNKKANTFFARK